MTIQRSPHLTAAPPASRDARNAALLIDFDNITLGVRSDLGKELRTLLNSEIFAGKVAVRRAYADWRRYPNYVVPLTEASIDLIFAPAYGTSKKNATDLRMAVDAIELAFMRPEIGTYILLTGDSDFSSCVIKLKEYGKYVIGVGMRDSSSDLLIQNCDEYYSYHALSGLMREGDQAARREDPWLLVRRAVAKMAAAGDSMRTDRLKQVMIDLDPGFDEKDEGYSKFSKFVQVAAEKGLLRLHRVENGQYEVAPAADAEEEFPAALPAPRRERDEDHRRDRDRDRRRERRDRDRERGRDRGPRAERPVRLVEAEPEAGPEPAAAAPAAREEELPVEAPAAAGAPEVDPLQNAYALLHHAVRAMVSRPGQTVRDGDVKRRMLEMQPGFDEHELGFSKFSRFLRQAHDAEVIDLRRLGEGRYEVALPSTGTKLPPPVLHDVPRPQPIDLDEEGPRLAAETAAAPAGRDGRGRGRGRDRGRGRGEAPPAVLPGQAAAPGEEARGEETRREEPRREEPRRQEPRREEPRREDRPQEKAAPPTSASREGPAEAVTRGMRHRHGGRGGRWTAPSGPPPLLPGQVVHVPGAARRPEPAPEPRREAPRETAAAEFSPGALGLPAERAEIEAYLSTYKGVGRKTVESLVNRFGDRVFHALEELPDEVRGLLTPRRADPILEQWAADRDRRRQERAAAAPEPSVAAPEAAAPEAAGPVAEAPAAEASAEQPSAGAAEQPAGRGRGRRGGRGRGRGAAPAEPSPEEVARAEAPGGDTDPTLLEPSLRPGGGEEVPEEVPAEVAAHPDTFEIVPDDEEGEVDEHADSDPTLAEQHPLPPGEAQRRRRGRRGGRGRARRENGAAAPAEAAAPEPRAEPVAETRAPAREEPAPTAEAPAAEEAEAARGRSRSRRGRGKSKAAPPSAEAPAAAVAPAPTSEPEAAAPATSEAGGRPTRGRRGRGGKAAAPAAETPAPEPTPPPAAEKPAARGRGRARGGKAAGAAVGKPEPAPAPPAGKPAEKPAEKPAAGGRGRGRGRGGGAAAAEGAAPAPEPKQAPAAEGGAKGGKGGGRGRGRRGRGDAPHPT